MSKLNPYFGEFGGQFVPQILIRHSSSSKMPLLPLRKTRNFSVNLPICCKTMPDARQP